MLFYGNYLVCCYGICWFIFFLIWYLHFKVVPVFLGENSDWEPLQRILALCSGNIQDRKGGYLSPELLIPVAGARFQGSRAASVSLGRTGTSCMQASVGRGVRVKCSLVDELYGGSKFWFSNVQPVLLSRCFPMPFTLKSHCSPLFPTRSGDFTKVWLHQSSLYLRFLLFPLAHTKTSSVPSASCDTGLQMPSRPSWMFPSLELLPALPG